MTIRAYGQRSTRKLASITTLSDGHNTIQFGEKGWHVEERLYGAGEIVHITDSEWDVQIFMFGASLTPAQQHALVSEFIGLDQ
jgi:hypothetical protein